MEKTIRIAEKRPVDEFRSMKVGDVVRFPIPQYNYNTLRQMPATSCINQTFEGWKWTIKKDFDNKCVDVTRIA